ncbi:hypothetical protein ACX80W_04545 [Arthrobacter sp. TMN-37]
MAFIHDPPIPPDLSGAQIRALIQYAERMRIYMEIELSRADEDGLGHAALHLPAVIEGWRFTAQAISETYDGEF